MVQTALDLLAQALTRLLSVLPALLVAALVLIAALLTYRLLGRDRLRTGLHWATDRGWRLGRWVLVPVALGAATLMTDIAHRSVQARIGGQVNARYTNTADPNTAQTVQQAPTVTYLSERTYTRTLVIPPELLRQVRREGVQVLAPYLQDPSSENILRLRDRFTRSGQNVVFSREATLQSEEFIPLDTSRVSAELLAVNAADRQSAYNAAFTALYRFRNPLAQAATVRFQFPLPQGSGTLSGFTMSIDGQSFTSTDLSSGSSTWEGRVAPGAVTEVRVTYRHQGARGWNYDLSARRERVRDFELTLRTDQATRFQRYSLYPTGVTGGTFGGPQTLKWQLQNAITAQNIAVVFAQGSVRETLLKLYAFLPFCLLGGVLLVAVWGWLRRLPVLPVRLALAVLGMSLGFAVGGVLTGYLLPVPAELLGAALAFLLAVLCLGRAFVWPLLPVVLAPVTFLWVGNAGLLLSVLAVATLLLFLRAGAGQVGAVQVA